MKLKMIDVEYRKKRAWTILDRTSREEILDLLAEIERLQKKAETLYKAARPIADKMAEDEAMGAEFDEDGYIEVRLHKAEFKEFIAVVYNWNRES